MWKKVRQLSHEDIVAIYEVLLGRKPESEDAINGYLGLGSAAAVVRSIGQSREYTERNRSSPFYHYHACFDAQETMRRHAVAGLKPRDGCLTNFLGVVIDCKFLPAILEERAGQVEDIPIPANWHADIAEWGAALRAVDLAQQTFTMAELGCGWGCWMNNTGVAARRRGLKTYLIGVEGDEGHISFARESCAMNGFGDNEIMLFHGIAAVASGTALFPRQTTSGLEWGLEPVFHATDKERQRALQTGTHDELPMVSLERIIGDRNRLDLLHVDIQGGDHIHVPAEDVHIDRVRREVRIANYVPGAYRAAAVADRELTGAESRLTRTEEELRVGKRAVEAGEVVVGKHVETEHKQVPVNVKREEVVIERRPVNRETGASDIREDQIRVPLTEEEVVVDKRAVVKEELVIGKRVVEDQKTVDVDVRREEFDIDEANVKNRKQR